MNGTEGREAAVVATVTLGTMLAPLNSTMIAIALPRLVVVFRTHVGTAAWLVTMYLILMATLQPVAGKLGDRFGRRRLILAGLAAFGLTSIGAALATDLPVLFAFRALQAVSGAIALPNGAALLRQIVPANRRGTRFGLLGSATSLAAAAGPPLGGLLVGLADWRAIFLVNVLLVVPALLIGWLALPADAPGPGRTTAETHRFDVGGLTAGAQGTAAAAPPPALAPRPFDVGGAVWLSAVLATLAELLTRVGRAGSAAPLAVGVPLLAVALALLLRREYRHPDPVLQPRFFRRRTFAAATGAVALSNLAMYSTLLAVPLLLAARPGWSPARIGLLLAALSACTAACAPLGGRLADRYGRRWPVAGGLALLTVGLSILAAAGAAGVRLPLCLALAGVGLGLSGAGMQTAALEAVSAGEAGAAAGAYSTSRYLGSIVGSSVLAVLVVPAVSAGHGSPVFVLVAVAALCSAVSALAIEHRPAGAPAAAAG